MLSNLESLYFKYVTNRYAEADTCRRTGVYVTAYEAILKCPLAYRGGLIVQLKIVRGGST